MKVPSLVEKLGTRAGLFRNRKAESAGPPVLSDPVRFPYGAFRFKARLQKGARYSILTSSDLKTWTATAHEVARDETIEYLDSEAFKFNHRFYRLQAGTGFSANIIGYASVALPPGFRMIASPFENAAPVGEVFKGWPNGTTCNRFDTRLFKLTENVVRDGKWTNPAEKLAPGEGAIFYNPTSDYKTASFSGQVMQGRLSIPIPGGFSIRSSPLPQPGNLSDDLSFPIANGDTIHIFDAERQQYVLHPFDDGRWTAGPPILSVGESFWVAKTDPGTWRRDYVAEETPPGA